MEKYGTAEKKIPWIWNKKKSLYVRPTTFSSFSYRWEESSWQRRVYGGSIHFDCCHTWVVKSKVNWWPWKRRLCDIYWFIDSVEICWRWIWYADSSDVQLWKIDSSSLLFSTLSVQRSGFMWPAVGGIVFETESLHRRGRRGQSETWTALRSCVCCADVSFVKETTYIQNPAG